MPSCTVGVHGPNSGSPHTEKADDERKEGRRTRTLERQVPGLSMHDRNPFNDPGERGQAGNTKKIQSRRQADKMTYKHDNRRPGCANTWRIDIVLNAGSGHSLGGCNGCPLVWTSCAREQVPLAPDVHKTATIWSWRAYPAHRYILRWGVTIFDTIRIGVPHPTISLTSDKKAAGA